MSEALDLDAVFAQLEAQLAGEAAAAAAAAAPEVPAALAITERREAPRFPVEEIGRDVKLNIRGGSDARPLNLSETGILAETTSRLRPGGGVELVLQIDGVRQMLRATVVRSMVHSLGPTVFRTAFKFDERMKLPERK